MIRFIFCLLLTVPAWANAQATYDNFANSSAHTVASLTYPLTVGTGQNRQLAVFVFLASWSAALTTTVTGVTYNGVALTQIRTRLNSNSLVRGDLWAMPAGTQPASGANNVVVTLSGTLPVNFSIQSSAISVADVDQNTPFTSTADNDAISLAASVTLPSSRSNDLVVEGVCAGTAINSTPQTPIYSVNATDTACNSSGAARTAGGTTSLSYVVNGATSDSWVMIGASFKGAVAKRRIISD